MHKILDVTKPPIDLFFHIDIPLTILYGDVCTHSWIYSNYMQLYTTINPHLTDQCFIDFFHSINGTFRFLELSSCPWINFEKISIRDVTKKWDSIIEFIEEKINEEKYIGITVNTSNISNYDFSALHNLFIYGYDNAQQLFYATDHFRNGVYDFESIKYSELSNAIWYPHQNEVSWGNLEGVWLFSKIKRTHENIYGLNIKKIIYDFKCYTRLEGSIFSQDKYYAYGLDCYDNLLLLYNNIMKNGKFCDVKGIYTECAHKKLMVDRLIYLNEKSFSIKHSFIEEYKEIYKSLETAQMFTIKYNKTINLSILPKIIELISCVKEKEKELNTLIISDLSKYDNYQ